MEQVPESNSSSESPENIVYPTRADFMELQRQAEILLSSPKTKRTAVHAIRSGLSYLEGELKCAEKSGWNPGGLSKWNSYKATLLEYFEGSINV